MYLPPVLRPVAVRGAVPPAAQRLADTPVSVVRGVPGSYAAERLAGVIDGWQRLGDCAWLRAVDAQPVELRRSLASACRYRWSPVEGSATPTTSSVSDLTEGVRAAPEGAVIVLELGGRMTLKVNRLVSGLRPVLAAHGVRLVLVVESRMHVPLAHTSDCLVQTVDLFDGRPDQAELTTATYERLVACAGKHPAVLDDVHAAVRVWSADLIERAVGSATGFTTLVSALTRELLAALDADQRSALQVASTMGYWHPQMGTSAVPSEQLRPWVVPMEQQWGWVRPVWLAVLRRELARDSGARVDGGGPAWPSVRSAGAVERPAAARRALLEAHLLGALDVRVDGATVPKWHGQRGTSVLRYLLHRRGHAATRDELMEEFWPDVPPGVARNRLQVALSALRRSFLPVTTFNVVEYADGCYRIGSEFAVVVDVNEFDDALRLAAAAQRRGDRDAARSGYRRALALYRGDFASDAPFEQWTLLPRESLRLRLVDALDRLSMIELAEGRLDDCIATALRMIEVDPCREDAHRLLMRCYARQGRTYQALRQYEFCERILRATVDAAPARGTRELYEAIRGGAA